MQGEAKLIPSSSPPPSLAQVPAPVPAPVPGRPHLEGLGGGGRPLQLQGEHAGAEGQVVELQPLAEHHEQEGRLGQRAGGHRRLTDGRHLALLTLDAWKPWLRSPW